MRRPSMPEQLPQARFTDFRQVVQATLEKYKDATELAKSADGCFYGHATNNVGCAIGCHLTAEDAKWLDDEQAASMLSIFTENPPGIFLRKDYITIQPRAREIIGSVFDLSQIESEELAALQRAHDNSDTVEEFRQKLTSYLDTGKWGY